MSANICTTPFNKIVWYFDNPLSIFSPCNIITSPTLKNYCSFSGVPAVVDFASMRDAVKRMGGDPDKINPVCPADLVIDHSVQVDIARR